jgi:uncharacterized protein (UPF0332 family)
MTDKKTLYQYRIKQAEETFSDAEKILHRIFILRQEGDYKELVKISRDDAARSVADATEFLSAIKKFIKSDK